ncbi:Gfo/Idh/MocA family protein [Paenibacillus sp. Soil724D2]|uniref:Gfo/Idh/MocA family protein n=1 Tax=Paenibacillus sp. (strain Soil724D2) TaxID=1736392 RepID=UPI0007132C0B|nr:Gfo/Idh/MocA family oxidoreductase [Paenibacillus sp. Soil724D2]KRE43168.1 dehydrogenase [Paenibacillus sp. Soil724D2]
MKVITIGIIGTGFSAKAHIEAIRRIPYLQVVAIAASSLERAEEFAKEYGIPKAYGNESELIQDNEVMAVHNCTPNYMHYTINREVLLAGKHILSEKPLGISGEQTKELTRLAENSTGVNGVAFNYRHFPLIAEIKHQLHKQTYGKVNLVYGGFLQDWLLNNTDYNWRLEPKYNGASRALADIGSHWCDTVQYVLGKKIVKVFADLKVVHPIRLKPYEKASPIDIHSETLYEEIPMETEDYGSVLVHFEGGIQGVFTISQVSAGRKNKLFFEIAADKGTLAWNQEQPNSLWIGRRDQANHELFSDPRLLTESAAALSHYPGGHQEGWPDALKNMLIDFYSAIRNRTANESTYSRSFANFEEGDQIMKVMDAILESHRTEQWVKIE